MTATLNINKELNGIEISFDSKPEKAILDGLKNLGYRWHGVKKLWYAKNTPERLTFAESITNKKTEKKETRKKTPEKVNKYGVKIGDIFSASWGYEQTNVDFFQVIALVGSQSVRVREVCPKILADDAVSGMSSDRTYKITRDILPPAPHSVFIDDQENGDLKRIKPGYFKDEKKAAENCFFHLDSFADAHKCNGKFFEQNAPHLSTMCHRRFILTSF